MQRTYNPYRGDFLVSFGARLTAARNKCNLSRSALADRLSESAKAPEQEPFQEERLKKWEYSTNPVDITWIPALCDVLSVDAGYFFGEYPEFTRCASDIVKETGLTESAVSSLLSINVEHQRNTGGTYTDILKTLNTLLDESNWDDLYDYWRRIAAFLFAKGGDFEIPLSTGFFMKKNDVLGSLLLANNSFLLTLKNQLQTEE